MPDGLKRYTIELTTEQLVVVEVYIRAAKSDWDSKHHGEHSIERRAMSQILTKLSNAKSYVRDEGPRNA